MSLARIIVASVVAWAVAFAATWVLVACSGARNDAQVSRGE